MKNVLIISIAIVAMLTACDKDDDDAGSGGAGGPNPQVNTGIVSADIDGELFESDALTTQVNFFPGTAQNFNINSMSIAGIRFNNTTDSLGIIISMLSPNIDDFAAGETFYYTGNPLAKTGVGVISGTINGGEVVAETDTGLGFEVTISAIDFGTSKISGTFMFTCYDSDTDITYELTDGEFTDLLIIQ